MALSVYVKIDEVRAALGVSTDELSDATVKLPLYENVLTKDAAEIGTNCLSDYRTIDIKSKASRTEAEADFHLAFSLFSVFSVARHLTVSLPLFSPKTIGDGKAAVTRFSDSPYAKTIEAVKASYEEYRNYLIEKYAVFGGGSATTITPIPLVGVISPATDPVTEG